MISGDDGQEEGGWWPKQTSTTCLLRGVISYPGNSLKTRKWLHTNYMRALHGSVWTWSIKNVKLCPKGQWKAINIFFSRLSRKQQNEEHNLIPLRRQKKSTLCGLSHHASLCLHQLLWLPQTQSFCLWWHGFENITWSCWPLPLVLTIL